MSGASRRDLLIGTAATLAMSRAPAGAAALTSSEWDYASASALVAALRAKKVGALELTDRAIARIEALDPRINAVVTRDFERARRAARVADGALARGEGGALIGVPVTIKESFDVEGLPTTWGDPKFRTFRPKADALAVERLRAAGAVVLGKTNVPLWLADWQSYNAIYGVTSNPWNPARTPGGSSGGSAAALAAGFGAMSLGSDVGGSLRIPAHYCGVYAHRPTFGLVPRRGHQPPGAPVLPYENEFATVGPMARTAADLALALDVVAGPDPLDAGAAYRLALPPARHDRLSDYRVLILDAHPLMPTAASVRAAMSALREKLARAGVRIATASPALPDLADSTRLFVRLLSSLYGADLSQRDYERAFAKADASSRADRSLAAERARGVALTYRARIASEGERAELRLRWRAFFQEWDVVLCPVAPTPAFLHDRSQPVEARRLAIGGKRFPYIDAEIVWPSVAAVAGLPATIAPIARSEDELPIGVQIVGPAFGDRTTLAFAALVEHAFGGFVRPSEF